MAFVGSKDIKIYLFLGLFVSFALFVISPDSYTHDLYGRVDSAWFYMCGKAWMNGLTPYVDFSDSKGPLLWLIYGIGYLISPYNCIGVFWISCIWYTLTYVFTYKTAMIFLKDSKKSVICTLLMTLAYFNPWFHNETRAEDFCQLFIIISLYQTCFILYKENIEEINIKRGVALLGACFSSLLLIKFNIAAMQLVFAFYLLVVMFKDKRLNLSIVVYYLIGVFAVMFPFILYFILYADLGAFVKEYFINTTLTVSYNENILKSYIMECLQFVIHQPRIAILVITLLGCWLISYSLNRHRFFPILAFLFFWGITIRHGIYAYYYNSCAVFVIFLFIYLLSLLKLCNRWLLTVVSLFVLGYSTVSNLVSVEYGVHPNIFYKDREDRRDFYNIGYIMYQIKNPKILNVHCFEYGFGMASNSLPAGKYWALQNGFTEEMKKEHLSLIYEKKADFLLFNNINAFAKEGITEAFLNSIGYYECYRFGSNNERYLFTNKDVKQPPSDFHVSNIDVLLKRRIFNDK